MGNRVPSVVDLNAELAKLTMFRRFPEATAADRKGSVARLASYRDGPLLAIKAAGRDHWERHLTGDELIYVLDGTATWKWYATTGRPKSFALSAGTIAVIPQGAWHRFLPPRALRRWLQRHSPAKRMSSMLTTLGAPRAKRCE